MLKYLLLSCCILLVSGCVSKSSVEAVAAKETANVIINMIDYQPDIDRVAVAIEPMTYYTFWEERSIESCTDSSGNKFDRYIYIPRSDASAIRFLRNNMEHIAYSDKDKDKLVEMIMLPFSSHQSRYMYFSMLYAYLK